jgi:hypothetical protein
MYAAIRIDERYETIVLGAITAVTGVHRQDEIFVRVEGATLGEMETTEDLYVGGERYGNAGFVGGTQGIARCEFLGGSWKSKAG